MSTECSSIYSGIEGKYRKLLEQSFGAVIIHSDYRVVYANEDACRLMGAKKPGDILGKPILDLIHSDHKDIVKKRVGRMYERGDAAPLLEEKMLRLDGSVIDVEAMAVGFMHEGRPSVLLAFKDISDRKRTVEALRENEKFLQAIFDSIQDGISVFDKDFNILRINRTMEMWHPDMLPLVGKKCYYAYHGRAGLCEYCPSLTAMKEKRATVNIIPRDGPAAGWQEVYAFPLIDDKGDVSGAIHYVRDITGRKNMEDALKESEEKFRVLADTSPVAIVLHEGEKIIYVNRAGEELTGYSKEELYGMNLWSLIHPDHRAPSRETWKALMEGKSSPVRLELRVVRKDGGYRWVEVAAGMAELAGKRITILSVDDITGRKRVEEALKDSKSEAELYVDLMGHDINNLNQIGMGFLEIALGTLDLDEGGRALLSKSLGALEGSTRLIENVRTIQRAESGDLRNYPVDLGALLMKVKDYYSHVPGTDVTINYEPRDHFDVLANELLYDVFSNLVGNAIKYASQRPVIDILVIKAYEDGRLYYKVAVEDNGPGIPDEVKPILFTRSLRGTQKVKGSGIGLYLVKTLVKSYNGRVWAEDRVQGDRRKGSRFVVMLPGL